MPHNTEHPVPGPPAEIMPFHSESEASTDVGKSSASEFEDCTDERASVNPDTNCHFFPNIFSRDLNLSKKQSESIKTKETYEKMKQLLACIRHDTHQGRVCGDLKVVGLLLGLRIGYIRYMCSLFL